MGPVIETRALVAPVVQRAEPSARLSGLVAMLSESSISALSAVCHEDLRVSPVRKL